MWLSIRVSARAEDTASTDASGTMRNVLPVPTACGGSDGMQRVERDAERRRDLPLHVVARHGRPPLRPPLLHPHARDAPVLLEELEGERAEADLDRDGMDAVGRAGGDLPERRHHDGRPDRRVARVRDLLHRDERALEVRVRGSFGGRTNVDSE